METKPQRTSENSNAKIPESTLERIFINAYITEKGYKLESLHELPEGERKQLMIGASRYASAKLAEQETRAHLIKEIHDASQSVTS